MSASALVGWMARTVVAFATALTVSSPGHAAEIKLPDGSVWKGEVGAKVRVTYEVAGSAETFDGVVERADAGVVTVKGIDGSVLRLADLSAAAGAKTATSAQTQTPAAQPASGSGPTRGPAVRNPAAKPATAKPSAAKPAGSSAASAAGDGRWVVLFELDQVRNGAVEGLLAQPRVYVVPIKGQIGTDVSAEVVDTLVRDLKRVQPDIVVFQMESADLNRINHLADDDQSEFGLPDAEYIRDMVKRLQEEVPSTMQVMWVQDAVGVSSLMALAWRNLYLASDARFGGVSHFMKQVEERFDDADVRSKMFAARLGLFKGLVVQGGYPECLAEAMLIPSGKLSIEFVGRTSRWRGDDSGTWVVDSSTERPANFAASLAEESLLCDGLADSLDDLMFLLGYREYEVVDRGVRITGDHQKAWRAAMKDALRSMELASETEDDVAGLGKRRSHYDKVLSILQKYPFIENRMEFATRGINAELLEYQIDAIKKMIQQLNEVEKEQRRGGQGGGSGRGLGSPRG